MSVVGNVILAVAVVALTPGTIAEFQIGEFGIGTTADGAAVGIGGLGLGNCCLIGTGGGEGNYFGLLLFGGDGLFALTHQTIEIGPPGQGNYIDHILAEEQEVIGQGDHGEQVGGEGIYHQTEKHQRQIQKGEDPCLHRNHIHKKELGVGIHGGIGQKTF